MIGSTNIEQAIYTSARTSLGEGYHLAARSPGISEADARALSPWCPSHDGLLPDIPEQRSVNFFSLADGRYCVSSSYIDGEDYSLRGAPRLVTHLLLVATDVMARFSYDPFALWLAVELSGQLASNEVTNTPHLVPIALVGRATPVNETLLEDVLAEVGAARLGFAVEALLAGRPLAMRASISAEKLMAGLWQCLPVECRGEFSFTTGLQYSPRRPFDLVTLPDDPQARRRLAQKYEVRSVDLQQLEGLRLTAGGWGNHIAMTLARGGAAAVAEQLAPNRPGLTFADLPALAKELTGGFEIESSSQDMSAETASDSPNQPLRVAHAHGAHRRHQQQAAASSATLKAGSLSLAVSHSLMEKLDALDDAVFAAIAGEPGAIEQLQTMWPAVLAELPAEHLEESQEHYLSHALRTWEHFVQEGRSPERAVAALDVLTLICGDRPK